VEIRGAGANAARLAEDQFFGRKSQVPQRSDGYVFPTSLAAGAALAGRQTWIRRRVPRIGKTPSAGGD
jgi:hypothetical protein